MKTYNTICNPGPLSCFFLIKFSVCCLVAIELVLVALWQLSVEITENVHTVPDVFGLGIRVAQDLQGYI